MWRIEFTPQAERQIEKVDPAARARILKTLKRDLVRTGDPRAFGKALVGEWSGFWRYRIGDYRAIAKIEDAVVTVFIIEVAHRREIYR